MMYRREIFLDDKQYKRCQIEPEKYCPCTIEKFRETEDSGFSEYEKSTSEIRISELHAVHSFVYYVSDGA